MVVVDRPEPDGDVRLAEVDHGIARPRIAVGPTSDRPACHDMSLPDDAMERLVGVPEAEEIVGLVAGEAREDA